MRSLLTALVVVIITGLVVALAFRLPQQTEGDPVGPGFVRDTLVADSRAIDACIRKSMMRMGYDLQDQRAFILFDGHIVRVADTQAKYIGVLLAQANRVPATPFEIRPDPTTGYANKATRIRVAQVRAVQISRVAVEVEVRCSEFHREPGERSFLQTTLVGTTYETELMGQIHRELRQAHAS